MARERGSMMPEIGTAVRTGDMLMPERRAMLKRPPHILVDHSEIALHPPDGRRRRRLSCQMSRRSLSMKFMRWRMTSVAFISPRPWSGLAISDGAHTGSDRTIPATQKPRSRKSHIS